MLLLLWEAMEGGREDFGRTEGGKRRRRSGGMEEKGKFEEGSVEMPVK